MADQPNLPPSLSAAAPAAASPRLITDPSDPRRQVPIKKANSPFLAHQAEQARRRAQAQAKMASSKTASRTQRAQTRKQRSLCASLIKWALVGVLFALGAGQFIAGDILWGYRGKYVQKRYWFPPPQRLFTPEELALYNGLDPKRPIYLSIMGVVYDVTDGRRIYGPGGPYDFFSGRDASRAYVTGCFKPEQGHLTHDLRGLGVEELKGVMDWAR
ncbi:Putative steroid membrane receptor Hpr6.6/25-Dx [Ceraceosorus bombacis]|uniref:Putative steroid membrane receptor Hpr6.6/25-Dx n=1 Tax=Ceraceosorus bombacis TaxID=401625 RepID=A0A0P1BRL1_9BASI|nr:Putative steroid membrane receptor Hpr6.6/25-Dx [Ceraceosorus bombacis]